MRCGADLKADDSFHLTPERRLPAFDFQLLGIELYRRQRRIGADLLGATSVFGPQFEPALPPVRCSGQAVYGETQVGQDPVIDDIVEKYGIRVEGLLRQDDAIIKWPVLADNDLPGIQRLLL